MNYQKFIAIGNAATSAQMRKSKSGDLIFAAFQMAVTGLKDHTMFFPVVIFGKQGEAIVKYITKGRHVLVEGRVDLNNNRFNVIADRVMLGSAPQAQKSEEKKVDTK